MRNALLLAALISTSLTALGEIPWTADLKTAHQRATAEGKLLLVHFESDHCVWCDRLEAGAFQDPLVAQAIKQNYVAVKINASNNRKLAQYFQVKSFPTDVVVDASGAVHSHKTSPQAPDKYIAMLTEAFAKGGKPAGTPAAVIAAAPQPATAQAAQQASAVTAMPPIPAGATPGFQYAPVPAATPTQTAQPAQGGFALPPTAALATNSPAPATGNQFQLPSHAVTPTAPLQTASVAAGIPPAPVVKQNDGGASTITQNALAADAIVASQQSLTPPQNEQPVSEALADSEAKAAPLPPLAMDGYCAVTILEETKWVAGDKRFGAIHLGKLYLFASKEAQEKFLADPEMYTPALGGMDVVAFIDGKQQVDGSREFGLHHDGQLYFFANEESLTKFFQTPDAYSPKAKAIMQQATSQARTLR